MRKVIAAINMTIDGFCDHTYGIADDELHDHYTNLLRGSGAILYGRITYQLMEYWKTLLSNPSGNPSMDEFALVMNKIPKIVFSRSLKTVDWETATLATATFEAELQAQKQKPGKDILIGSPSLIAASTQLGLVDEYQLCIHPVIAGKGLQLFKNIQDQVMLKLVNTKIFGSGAIVHYYQPARLQAVE